MWGRRDSGEATEHAARRQSALTRDLQSLSSSAPDHAGAMAGAATATSHTHTPDVDLDHHATEQSGAVSIRRPSAAVQAASLQLGGNATHYAPNSLHLGAKRGATTSPVAASMQLAVRLAVLANSALTQHAQVSSSVCSLARQARRRSSAPSSTETRARRRRRRRRARRPCRHTMMLRRCAPGCTRRARICLSTRTLSHVTTHYDAMSRRARQPGT